MNQLFDFRSPPTHVFRCTVIRPARLIGHVHLAPRPETWLLHAASEEAARRLADWHFYRSTVLSLKAQENPSGLVGAGR